MKNNKKVKIAIIAVIAVVLILSIVLGIYFLKVKNNTDFEDDNINQGQVIVENPEEPVIEDGRNLQNEIKALNATYSDVIGWLVVPGTTIDTPVFQSKDNSRYLRNDRDNNWYMWGEEFLDYRCNINNMDNMSHFIIYGHNSEDDNNFAPLLKYKNEEFLKENSIIEFSTINGNYKWQIFSVYTTTTDFFYIDTNFENMAEYTEFLNTLKSKSMFVTGVELAENDTILTLSTCDYTLTNGRFVVQAKLIK